MREFPVFLDSEVRLRAKQQLARLAKEENNKELIEYVKWMEDNQYDLMPHKLSWVWEEYQKLKNEVGGQGTVKELIRG